MKVYKEIFANSNIALVVGLGIGYILNLHI